jgi:hypothetical protein
MEHLYRASWKKCHGGFRLRTSVLLFVQQPVGQEQAANHPFGCYCIACFESQAPSFKLYSSTQLLSKKETDEGGRTIKSQEREGERHYGLSKKEPRPVFAATSILFLYSEFVQFDECSPWGYIDAIRSDTVATKPINSPGAAAKDSYAGVTTSFFRNSEIDRAKPTELATSTPSDSNPLPEQQKLVLMTFLFGKEEASKRSLRIFAETASTSGADVVIVGDAALPFDLPANVRWFELSWDKLVDRVFEKLSNGA